MALIAFAIVTGINLVWTCWNNRQRVRNAMIRDLLIEDARLESAEERETARLRHIRRQRNTILNGN